jgi:hypothetical protein
MAINLVPMSTDVGGRGGQDPLVAALGRRQQASPFAQMRQVAQQQQIGSPAHGNMALATALLGGIGEGFEAGQQQRQKQQGAQQVGTFLRQMGLSDEEARTATALAVSNPEALTPFLRQAAEARFRAPATPPQQPNDVREYEFARGQGFQGTFFDYQRQLRESSRANTNVSVDNRGTNAEETERGKARVKIFQDLAGDLGAARQDRQAVNRLAQIATTVEPGPRTAVLEALRQSTGIALDPNANNVQAYDAMINYLMPRMRVPGSGASSDRDLAAFRRALPALTGTREGNELVIGTLGGMAEYRERAAQIGQSYLIGRITAEQANDELQKIPDPFATFRQLQEQQQGQQQGQQQQQAAPPAPDPAAAQPPPQQPGQLRFDPATGTLVPM